MDSARSWVVAGACFWINMFSYPLLGAAGVIYVNILRTFDVTREEASWPVSLTSTFYLLAGLLGGALSKYITIRTILLISCTVSGILVSCCYFTTGLRFMIVVLGILHGIAVGGIRLNVVAVNKHFVKHLATASGINMAGLSVGGFILPPLLQLLFDQFGFRGALLICGGITLNAVPAALLCGDPEAPKSLVSSSTKHKESSGRNFVKDHDPDHEEVSYACGVTVNGNQLYHKVDGGHENQQRKHARHDQFSELLSKNTPCAPQSSKGTAYDVRPNDETALNSMTANRSQVTSSISKSSSQHTFSFVLKPRFYLVTFTHLVVFTNMATFLTVIIDFAVDCAVPKWRAVLLVSVYSFADVAARLGSGWVTDRKYLSRGSYTTLCLLCWTLALASMPLGRSFYWLLVCAVVSGWCNGSTLSLVPVLFSEVTSARHYAVCFGTGSSLVGLACLLRPLLIGFFRDRIGGYGGLFYFHACCTGIALVFWVWMTARSWINARNLALNTRRRQTSYA